MSILSKPFFFLLFWSKVWHPNRLCLFKNRFNTDLPKIVFNLIFILSVQFIDLYLLFLLRFLLFFPLDWSDRTTIRGTTWSLLSLLLHWFHFFILTPLSLRSTLLDRNRCWRFFFFWFLNFSLFLLLLGFLVLYSFLFHCFWNFNTLLSLFFWSYWWWRDIIILDFHDHSVDNEKLVFITLFGSYNEFFLSLEYYEIFWILVESQ